MSSQNVLTFVGAFRELGYPNGPSLLDARGKRGPRDKDAVVAYLRAAPAMVWTSGIHHDVFDPSKGTFLHIQTDGRFAWHKALEYYVDKYDVVLPADFEEHIRQNHFKVPESIVTRNLVLPPQR